MALELKLDDKPFYWGLGIGLALAIGLAVALEYFVFTKMKNENKGRQAKLAQLEDEVSKGRAAEKTVVQFKEEVKKLELELEKLLRILPSRYNTDELIKKVETLANQGEFNLRRFAPDKLSPKEFYAEWPIRVDLDGTYHNLALFFDKLAKFSRIINIQELNIQALPPSPNAKRTISANFIAKTFIYLGDQAEEGAKK
jgi:type IV pilus assembly protein PilO